MADSQNTYQNDVKINNSNKGTLKIFAGIFIIFVTFISCYFYTNTQVEISYNEGYKTGRTEGFNSGKEEGYKNGHIEGYELGFSEGVESVESKLKTEYSKGYREGYIEGQADEKAKSKSSNSNKSSSNSNTNYYSGSYNSSNNYSTNNEKEYNYVLNKNTKKFHYSWCYSVDQMKEKNKIYATDTRTAIINRGYSPCGNCHP